MKFSLSCKRRFILGMDRGQLGVLIFGRNFVKFAISEFWDCCSGTDYELVTGW